MTHWEPMGDQNMHEILKSLTVAFDGIQYNHELLEDFVSRLGTHIADDSGSFLIKWRNGRVGSFDPSDICDRAYEWVMGLSWKGGTPFHDLMKVKTDTDRRPNQPDLADGNDGPIRFQLRDYQQKQLNFIHDRVDLAHTLAIESGTGTGKTITFLTFISEWLNEPENSLTSVVVSTGFNHLVFQMERVAKSMGMDTCILIGNRGLNCRRRWREYHGTSPYEPFTESTECRCIRCDNWDTKDGCPLWNSTYRDVLSGVETGRGKVIITNHSSYCSYQGAGYFVNSSLLVVDEAHTFGTFYDSWLQLELDRSDLAAMDIAINSLKNPWPSMIKMNLKNGKMLPKQQLDAIAGAIKDKTLRQKVLEFFSVKPAPNNYVEMGPDGYRLHRFYHYFEMWKPKKTILFSATMDDFTLTMFNCKKSDRYREVKMLCDYSLSEFIAIPRDDYLDALRSFLRYVDGKRLQSGLILSTTNKCVQLALDINGFQGYSMYTSIEQFQNARGKRVLVGSRALFQGVDIGGLEWVCLNSIPFPNWNDENRARQRFLTNDGKSDFDPWNGWTIPKTENDITQALGRLWRGVNDKGVVSIFDPRIERFKYMIKHTMHRHRHGIQVKIMDEHDHVKDFDLGR